MSAILTRFVARFDIPAQATNRTLLLLNRMTLAIISIAIVHAGVMSFVLKRLDIAVYGLLAVILLLVLVFRKRISIAIALIKEGSK